MKFKKIVEDYFESIGLKKDSKFVNKQMQFYLHMIKRAKHYVALFSYFTGLKDFKNLKIFEPACCIGPISIYTSKLGNFSVGCDKNKEFLKLAHQINKVEKGNAHFVVCNCFSLPFKEGIFDISFIIDLLEHTDEQKKMIDEISFAMKSNSYAVIKVSNKLFPIEPHTYIPFLSYMPSKLADFFVRNFRKEFYAWYDSYDEIDLPTYPRIKSWLKNKKIKNIKYHPVFLDYIPYVGEYRTEHSPVNIEIPNFMKKLFSSRSFMKLISKLPFILFSKDWYVIFEKE